MNNILIYLNSLLVCGVEKLEAKDKAPGCELFLTR
jgi:hypothetical protein